MSILETGSTAREVRAVALRQPMDQLVREVYSLLKEEVAKFAMRGMTILTHTMNITDANPLGVVEAVSKRLRHEGFRVEVECTESFVLLDPDLRLEAEWRISW